jgi:pyruvate/2-oxoacid:ferredoxin oxidoreductase beta subunit
MTREEFTELFSKEMTARGFVIVEKYANCITFYHNSKPAIEDWLVLRYGGKKENKEWVATEDDDKRYFKFQVQDHETYNLDWDWNNNCTSLEYVIGETEMTVFVDDVVKAAGKYI